MKSRLKQQIKHAYYACFYLGAAVIVWRLNHSSSWQPSSNLSNELAGMHSAIITSNIVLTILVIALLLMGIYHVVKGCKAQ